MSIGSRSKDVELGDILQAARLVDPGKLALARQDSQRLGRPLWSVLTNDNLLTEDALFRCLRQEVRVPVLAADQLPSVSVPPELLRAIPAKVAQGLGILPLERSTDGRRVALAMVDPTAEITPLWPALSAVGVTEVRRFLVHLGTLRLGLETFYGVPWQAEPPPEHQASLMPPVEEHGTSLAELVAAMSKSESVPVPADALVLIEPELTRESARSDSGSTERVGGSSTNLQPLRMSAPTGRAGESQPLSPVAAPLSDEVTSRLVVPASTGPAPTSVAPVAITEPHPRAAHPLPVPIPVPAALPSGPARGGSPLPIPAAVTAPLPARPPAQPPVAMPAPKLRLSREVSLPEISLHDFVVIDEPSAAMLRPSTGYSDASAVDSVPLQEVLFSVVESLIRVQEQELGSSRPTATAQLCRAVAERLGFAPRANTELMLVARLYGLLRLRLSRTGPLPKLCEEVLGFEVDDPLMKTLRSMQQLLVDFMRMPTEKDIVPLGSRIVQAVAQTLSALDEGQSVERIVKRLRLPTGDTLIHEALAQIVESDLPVLGIVAEPPRPLPTPSVPSANPAPAPVPSSPLPEPLWMAKEPQMPTVRWETRRVSTIDGSDLSPL